MNIKSSIFLLIILLNSLFLFANGGVVNYSHFRKTGNIRLMQKADISLIKEELFIKIEGDFTIIEVKYLLKNNGEDDILIYGFPVDAYETGAHEP